MHKKCFQNIAVLSPEKSWIIDYSRKLISILESSNYNAKLFYNHEEIENNFEIVFILGYTRVIGKKYLLKHKHNLVIHESDLPKGKGWSPLFWQILEGKSKIPVVLFEASEKIDDGHIYIKDYINLQGDELNKEIRHKQGEISVKLCLEFLSKYEKLIPVKQTGEETFFDKRTPANSELDIDKSIKDQFNLLRIVSNDEFPAFFYMNGVKYKLKIFRYDDESQ